METDVIYRSEMIARIHEAMRPRPPATPEQQHAGVQALGLVMVTCFLQWQGIPYSIGAVVELAAASGEAMQRWVDDHRRRN